MAVTASFDNSTVIMNTTEEDHDYFCVKLFVGPLVWGVFSAPCACVGVPATVWLLWVLIQKRKSGSSNNSDVYILNLAVMDLIYNIFKLLSTLNFFVWHNVSFAFLYFFDGFNYNGRPLLMACSCVDCYMAVVHPIRYMRISQSRYRAVVSAVVWVLTLTFGLCYMFIGNQVHQALWNIPGILAISTITLSDIVILRTLRRPDPSGRPDVHPQKQRALQTITNSFVMTLVSYSPRLLILVILWDVIPLSVNERYCEIFIPSSILSMLGSTILPLLYLRNLGSFNDLRRCLCI